jgi:hypothetical protein
MEKIMKQLLFLKSTGCLVGEVTDEATLAQLDLSKFHVKSVVMGEYEVWEGDYYTGKIVSVANKAIVRECDVVYSSNVRILQEYPVHKQLNIIMDLIDQANLPRTREYEEMRDFIRQVRSDHLEKIETYKSNPDAYIWYSLEDERRDIKNKTIV